MWIAVVNIPQYDQQQPQIGDHNMAVTHNTYQRERHHHCNLKQTNKIAYNDLLGKSVICARVSYKHGNLKQWHHCEWTKYVSIVTFDKL